MSEVERICDRIAIMHRGRIIDSGPMEDLRDRHGESDLEELFFRLVTDAEPSGDRNGLPRYGGRMNLRNVLWIWRREMRDQFRDRRTCSWSPCCRC